MIRSLGNMAGPVRAELPLPMIATRDIGIVATDALLKRNFRGKTTRELHGASDRSYVDAARVIGEAIGKPGLAYHQMPAMLLRGALQKMGMSSDFVDLLLKWPTPSILDT